MREKAFWQAKGIGVKKLRDFETKLVWLELVRV